MTRAVNLTIQGCTLTLDLYVLSMHGSDIVLGVSWLATLGLVVTDYSQRTFEFSLHNTRHSWVGNPPIDVQLQGL